MTLERRTGDSRKEVGLSPGQRPGIGVREGAAGAGIGGAAELELVRFEVGSGRRPHPVGFLEREREGRGERVKGVEKLLLRFEWGGAEGRKRGRGRGISVKQASSP